MIKIASFCSFLLIMVSSVLVISGNHSIMMASSEEMNDLYNEILNESEIWVHSSEIPINRSYHIPIPVGATVLNASFSLTKLPSGDEFPDEVWINVADGTKEYEFRQDGEKEIGEWGYQNRTYSGEDTILLDTSDPSPDSFDILIPKNATVEEATLTIHGHQRKHEWDLYTSIINEEGDHGSKVKYIDENLFFSSSLSFQNDTGKVNVISYPEMTLITSFNGLTEKTNFGFSVSDTFHLGSKRYISLIGGPGHNNSQGYVFIALSQIGPVPGIDEKDVIPFTPYLHGLTSSEEFGYTVELGNIDGDKDPELVIGAPGWNHSQGCVYIYSINIQKMEITYKNKLTVDNSTRFGSSIAIGNYNGDNYPDLAISSKFNVDIFFQGNHTNEYSNGTIDIGQSSGQISDMEFCGYQFSDQFESLAIGLPEEKNGEVHIYTGNVSVDSNHDVTITSPSNRELFGYDIEPGYDLNSDERSEIVIGAPGFKDSNGWVGIYSISSDPTIIEEFSGHQPGSLFGSSLDFQGDFEEDGFNDLIIGYPHHRNETNVNIGKVDIFERYHTFNLPINTPSLFLEDQLIWEFDEPNLYAGDSRDVQNFENWLNIAISGSTEYFSNGYDSFVKVSLVLVSETDNSSGDSSIFTIDDLTIVYDYSKQNINMAEDINRYLSNQNVPLDEDGENALIPIVFYANEQCGILIDDIHIEIDDIPQLTYPIQKFEMDEDSVATRFIDIHSLFSDDRTPTSSLDFTVDKIGLNFSIFIIGIEENRFISIDMLSGEKNDNWTGNIELKITATDLSGGSATLSPLTISVNSVNDAPALSSELPNQITSQGATWKYQPEFIDDEDNEFSFDIDGPANMTIDDQTNITWTPSPFQVGKHDWILSVTDSFSVRNYTFEIEVTNINDPPYFVSPPPSIINHTFGDEFRLILETMDYDHDDILTYSLIEGPTGTFINSLYGILTWTPYIYTSEEFPFRIRITDSKLAHSEISFIVRLFLEDLPPEINSEPETQLFDLDLWVYHMIILDPDDDYISIDLINPPHGMEFNDVSHTLTWTPGINQVGSIPISIQVSSTRFVLFHNFTLYVERNPRNWSVSILHPGQGDSVSGNVKISGEALIDPGTISAVYVKIGDGDWEKANLNGNNWNFIFDTLVFNTETILIEVRAYDGFEYSDIEQLTVSTRAQEPSSKLVPIMIISIFIILLVSLIAIGLFVLYNKVKLERDQKQETLEREQDFQQSKNDLEKFIDSVSIDNADDGNGR